MRCLVVLALLLAVAHATDSQDRESEQYGVLRPGAHEAANCVALQGALHGVGVDPTVANSAFFKEFAPMFKPGVLNCNLISSVGAVASGVIGTATTAYHATTNWVKGLFGRAPPNNPGGHKPDETWPALILGSREMDLPCETRDSKVDNCLLAVARGGILSKLAGMVMSAANIDGATNDLLTKKIEVNKFSPMAADSHFGYMSVGHAQTADRPGDSKVPGVVQALKNPSVMGRYKFPRRTRSGIANPTQGDVRNMMVDFALHLYDLAIRAATNTNDPNRFRFLVYHMGRIGHMIMDSFSCAHCARQADAQLGFPILFFQDYGSQDGSLHAANGDSLIGSSPFLTGSFGYQYGIKLVSKVYRIMIHKIAAALARIPYKSVTGFRGSSDPARAEFANYLTTVVFKFAAPGFERHPAAGCVVKNTMAPGKEAGVCKASVANKYLKDGGNRGRPFVCPDKPMPFTENFMP